MTTPISTPDAARLTRILGFLACDPVNTHLLQEALVLTLASGDLQHAKTLSAHIATYPVDDAEIWAHAVHLQLLIRNFAAASQYGDRAIQAGIAHPVVLLNTAYGHFYSRNFARCHAVLDTLASFGTPATEALILHARALHHLAMPSRAEILLMQVLQREPAHVEAKGLLALLLHEGEQSSRAMQLAHEVLAHDPHQLDALLACASAHAEKGNMEAARKTWRHTVASHPDCGRAWSGLAQVEFHALEFADAEEHLKLALSHMPDHIGTWHLLAWLYILQNDSDQARKALEASCALNRSFGETHGGLAVVDVLDGKLEDAKRGIRRALKLNPAGMSARYAEMLLLQKAGKHDDAARLVGQLLARQAPGSQHSGRVLMERWLQERQGKTPRPSSGQH